MKICRIKVLKTGSFDAVGTQNVSFSLDEMTFKHFVQSNPMVGLIKEMAISNRDYIVKSTVKFWQICRNNEVVTSTSAKQLKQNL
jgi:hypothetical protein